METARAWCLLLVTGTGGWLALSGQAVHRGATAVAVAAAVCAGWCVAAAASGACVCGRVGGWVGGCAHTHADWLKFVCMACCVCGRHLFFVLFIVIDGEPVSLHFRVATPVLMFHAGVCCCVHVSGLCAHGSRAA